MIVFKRVVPIQLVVDPGDEGGRVRVSVRSKSVFGLGLGGGGVAGERDRGIEGMYCKVMVLGRQ